MDIEQDSTSLFNMKSTLRNFSRHISPILGLRRMEHYVDSIAFFTKDDSVCAYPAGSNKWDRNTNLLASYKVQDSEGPLYAMMRVFLEVYWHFILVSETDKILKNGKWEKVYFNPKFTRRGPLDHRPSVLDEVGYCYLIDCARSWLGVDWTRMGDPIKCQCDLEWKRSDRPYHSSDWRGSDRFYQEPGDPRNRSPSDIYSVRSEMSEVKQSLLRLDFNSVPFVPVSFRYDERN